MRLCYNAPGGVDVTVGDIVTLDEHGKCMDYIVCHFRPPHKASSEGKVSLRPYGKDDSHSFEVYCGVIGATWVEREDRMEAPFFIMKSEMSREGQPGTEPHCVVLRTNDIGVGWVIHLHTPRNGGFHNGDYVNSKAEAVAAYLARCMKYGLEPF
jgi:hypothetical protein